MRQRIAGRARGSRVGALLLLTSGMLLLGWGASLAHHRYAHARDVTYLLKAEELPQWVRDQHRTTAVEEVFYHLGFVVVGTMAATLGVGRLWSRRATRDPQA